MSVSFQTRKHQHAYRIIHREDILVERGVNSNDIPHLVVNLQLERIHGRIEVDLVQITHQEDLTHVFLDCQVLSVQLVFRL
jgi:hypothetical protein